MPELSFVIAALDEAESLPPLLDEIRAAAKDLGRTYEVVVVDDASTDGSAAWLRAEEARRPDLRVIVFERHRGQSAALAAGFAAARGEILVTMDADLQNDPADTGLLLDALDGCDLVVGVRATREDGFGKRLGSRIGNGVRRFMLGDRFRDVGCALRAWRWPVAAAIPKFRGFHRFIPILAERAGFRVEEVEVSHRPRLHGRTHYGNLGRAVKGFADAWAVRSILEPKRPEPRA